MVWMRPSVKALATGYSRHVAVAAVQLQAAVGDPLLQLGGPPLGHRGVHGVQFAVGVVGDAAVEERPGDGALGGHLGDLEADVLELGRAAGRTPRAP